MREQREIIYSQRYDVITADRDLPCTMRHDPSDALIGSWQQPLHHDERIGSDSLNLLNTIL